MDKWTWLIYLEEKNCGDWIPLWVLSYSLFGGIFHIYSKNLFKTHDFVVSPINLFILVECWEILHCYHIITFVSLYKLNEYANFWEMILGHLCLLSLCLFMHHYLLEAKLSLISLSLLNLITLMFGDMLGYDILFWRNHSAYQKRERERERKSNSKTKESKIWVESPNAYVLYWNPNHSHICFLIFTSLHSLYITT